MDRVHTITHTLQLTTLDCSVCGIIFAIPTDLYNKYLERGGSWYCPNGHGQQFIQTEVQRLRHQLDQREAELERTYERLDGAFKEITNKQRVITRMKTRVHAGVCTECKRHFVNLERHMKTKHSS